MSLKSLFPLAEISSDRLKKLEKSLTEFYNNPPASYYIIADTAADHYNHEELPFHCHLASQVYKGAKVLDLGCGSAHLCPHVENNGGIYHGADYNQQLLALNRTKFTQAIFWKIDEVPVLTFDLVVSLYTIEHVVDPKAYLHKLWDHCSAGGLIGIICPDFIDGEALPRSIYFGKSAKRIREKILNGYFLDALFHLWELKIAAPRWKLKAQSMPFGAFWINLDPSDLVGKEHGIDGDAVHLPRLRDIEDWFLKMGAEVLVTSHTMPNISSSVSKHNCYILIRKPK